MDDARPRARRFLGLVAALGVCLAPTAPALAADQLAEQTAPVPAQPVGTRDFLFGRPRGWAAVRGSWLMPRATGDLFAFVSDQLTVEKKDFSAPGIAGEFGLTLTSRVSAVAGVEFSRRTVQSEYRRYVDNLGLAINQQTALAQTNLTGSIKVALWDRGRSISSLAFVPRTFVPYAGAGAGMLYYEFEQHGDFVDFVTLRVFPDTFRSAGWTPSAHVFGGTEIRLWRVLFLDLEGRYVWAHGTLGSDFLGFDGVDLNGFRFSTGVSVMF